MRNRVDQISNNLDEGPRESEDDDDLDIPSVKNKDLPTYRDMDNEEDDYIGEDSHYAERSDLKQTFNTKSYISSALDR